MGKQYNSLVEAKLNPDFEKVGLILIDNELTVGIELAWNAKGKIILYKINGCLVWRWNIFKPWIMTCSFIQNEVCFY